MIKIYINDLRRNGLCLSGAKRFFDEHGLDWRAFVKDGINSDALEATGDCMALKLVEDCNGR